MISNGLGRLRTLGGPSGSQCKVGAFSWAGTGGGPFIGLAASNRACPQGVNGGRNLSSMAFMPGTPGAGPSGYCIQTPERSCDRAEVASGVFGDSICLSDCANTEGENDNIAARIARDPAKGIVRNFRQRS